MNDAMQNLDTNAAAEDDRAHVWHHLTQHQAIPPDGPLMIVRGEGLRVTDRHGREYLDAVAGGVWTVNVGYGRKSIADAVRDQLVDLCFYANVAANVPGARFAAMLTDKMPGLTRVYYSVSGSEANEKGFKLVRQLAELENKGKKHKILYRDRDYHGTTITALSAGGHAQRREQYGPFTPGFVEVPHCLAYRSPNGDDPDFGVQAAKEIERIILAEGPDTVGAFIVEPITAGGGVIPPPPGYFETVQEICGKYGILLHLDEVVCGMGRTGKWFGYQHYGIKPDMVTIAKGVTSGYAPLGLTVTTEALFDRFLADPADTQHYFRDISTFGGCAGGPAAAIENMAIIERENLVENSAKMGVYLLEKLHELEAKHPIIGEVRGVGLFAGLELVVDRKTKEPLPEPKVAEIAANCVKQGVLIGRSNRSLPGLNNTLSLSPALMCTRDDIDEIIAAMDQAIGTVGASL